MLYTRTKAPAGPSRNKWMERWQAGEAVHLLSIEMSSVLPAI